MEREFQAGRMWMVGPGPGCGSSRAAGIGLGLGHQVRTKAGAGWRSRRLCCFRSRLAQAPSRFLVDGISVRNKWGFALRPRSVWFYQRLWAPWGGSPSCFQTLEPLSLLPAELRSPSPPILSLDWGRGEDVRWKIFQTLIVKTLTLTSPGGRSGQACVFFGFSPD